MNFNRKFVLIAAAAGIVLTQAGCAAAPGLAAIGITGADNAQTANASGYQYKVQTNTDKTFSAALTAAADMGTVLVTDRTSGQLQFLSGNWRVTAVIVNDAGATKVSLTHSFHLLTVDMRNRDAISEQFIKGLQTNLGANVAVASIAATSPATSAAK